MNSLSQFETRGYSLAWLDTQGQMNVNWALYYDIGSLVDWARKADVLFLGNSRPFYAFRDNLIQTMEKGSGLKFYSLAGPGNNFPYSEAIIYRNHLFPRLIVINEDNFFNPKLIPPQKEAMTGSWWQGWSYTYSNYFKWLINFYLRKSIPEFVFFKADHGKKRISLGSPETGFLFFENNSEGHQPLIEGHEKNSLNPIYLGMARKFIREMEDRGCEVILTFVPYGKNTDFVVEEADELGVPCILPKVKGLETFDGFHLTPESSERFGKAFFELFFKLPEVQKLVKERKKKNFE